MYMDILKEEFNWLFGISVKVYALVKKNGNYKKEGINYFITFLIKWLKIQQLFGSLFVTGAVRSLSD